MSLAQVSLEALFSGAGFAGIPASPAQRAICRAADGLALGDIPADVVRPLFGCDDVPAALPRVVCLVAGVRGGKSFMAACAAIRCVFRADLSGIKSHEVARAAIVASSVDNAEATFKILCGIVDGSPLLRACRVGERTADTLVLRRPDGRLVEVVVVAASRGGSHLRSRWLVACILDEAALMGAEGAGAAVSAEELLRAGRTRLLPGGQAFVLSSPFGPTGLLYDTWKAFYGHPGSTLVAWAPTKLLNPAFDTALIDEVRREAPDVAAREYDATWLDATRAMFDSAAIDGCIRTLPLVRRGASVAAAMDAGTRGNAWTLCTAFSEGTAAARRTIIGGAHEWKGSKTSPLSPDAVLKEIAAILLPQGCETVACDGWSFDANADIARRHGLTLVQVASPDTIAAYARTKALFDTGAIELPPVPQLRADLLGVVKNATAGGVRIALNRTADGRHCDFAPSLVNAATRARSSEVMPSGFTDADFASLNGIGRYSGWGGANRERTPFLSYTPRER